MDNYFVMVLFVSDFIDKEEIRDGMLPLSYTRRGITNIKCLHKEC